MRIFECLGEDRGFIARAWLVRAGLVLASLPLVLFLTRAVQAQQVHHDAGFVLNVRGDWFMTGSDTALRNFERVPPGAVIVPSAENTPGGEIEIALANGALVERHCENPDECGHQPIRMPASPKADPLMIRLFGPPLDDFDDYVTAISRGVGGAPKEVVLKLDEGSLDLLPLMEGRAAGSYVLDFKRPPGANKPAVSKFEVRIAWDPKTPAAAESVRASEANAGLFAVKYPGDYEDRWTRALILPPRDYEPAQAQFQQARKLAQSWGGTSLESRHRFLRLYLWHLASSTPSKRKAQ